MAVRFIDEDTNIVINFPSPIDNCTPQETTIRNVRLAAAYIPYQKLCTLLSPENALKAGTIFPELFSPYKKMDNHCSSKQCNTDMEC
jgi:hypothetical protein